jgi:uncharacterized protein YdeI (YjbR/CyaY-like superfamily)
MDIYHGVKTFYAKSEQTWRQWLEQNHLVEQSVWLVIYRKESNTPSVYYPEAVDQALCFGWIDSLPNKRDEHSYYQFFSRRNPKSNWSKVNKAKVERLQQEGMMHATGLAMVELAKVTGTWTALDQVEELSIPADLQILFDQNSTAWENWQQFSRSSRRGILEWILTAKRPETRQKRITETVTLAQKNVKANHST